MPYGYQSVPFWEFVRSMDAADRTGAGVEQPTFGFQHFGPPPPPPFAFGFGPGPFGPHHRFGGPGGCARGRGHCRRPDDCQEKPDHCKKPDAPGEKQPSDGEKQPEEPSDAPRDGNGEESHHHGPRHWRGRPGRGPCGGRRGGPTRHGFGDPADAPFDLSALIDAFASHPIAQAMRTYAEEAGLGAEGLAKETDPDNTFVPPIDIFSTPSAYVLHVALPGAKKEDVGVNWDAEKNELNVAGVVYRQGDEDFLKLLSKTERKVGVFERSVKLPPAGDENKDKDEVDGDAITAKLEDGVLVVTVPKVEKEWTEVKKVDIE